MMNIVELIKNNLTKDASVEARTAERFLRELEQAMFDFNNYSTVNMFACLEECCGHDLRHIGVFNGAAKLDSHVTLAK
ncbi:hypothetical protein NW995_002507 [Salmonella enterica]|nr:hypothetical protein [Salmonella enterica]